MIKGKCWPIPNDRILDGSIITLKNSYRLAKDAEILLKEKKYSTSLTIATLALEEFGKHCIMTEYAMSNTEIDSKFWFDTIKNHGKKLNAIPDHLGLYPNSTEHQKKELQRYRKYLLKLSKMKLEHLYLDWDDIDKKWSLIVNSKSIKEKAKFAVETAHWTIEKYIEDVSWDRELLFMPHTSSMWLCI